MANAITLSRIPILLGVVFLLYAPSPAPRFVGVALLVIVIALDTLDGVVARARHEVSLRGSVLDVMVDRVVELVLWVCFADLRLIPVAIPIICIMRGTIVDSLRSMQVGAGRPPLSAAQTRLGQWIMGSPIMRTSYGVAKLVSFTGLAFTHAFAAQAPASGVAQASLPLSATIFNVTSWVAMAFCLTRGLPVIIEAFSSSSPGQTES